MSLKQPFLVFLTAFSALAFGAARQTFNNAPKFPVGITPIGQVSGDFNRDGNIDLAVLNRDSSNVSILLGTGRASFAPAVNYAVDTAGVYVTTMVAGDLNNDGSADLLVGF